MINHALLNFRIKTDLKTVEKVLIPIDDYGYLFEHNSIEDFNHLIKKSKEVRFPVVTADKRVIGIVSMRDVLNKSRDTKLSQVMTKTPITANPNTSLANISQKMIFEDLNMLPVVDQEGIILGVVTRRLAMENLQNNQKVTKNTYSEHILSELYEYNDYYQILVEPSMIDATGNLAQGVISEILKEITYKVFNRKYQKNIIIEQMMIYFLHAAQIDDQLKIYPKIITETRRSGILDFEIYVENQVIAKSIITSKLN